MFKMQYIRKALKFGHPLYISLFASLYNSKRTYDRISIYDTYYCFNYVEKSIVPKTIQEYIDLVNEYFKNNTIKIDNKHFIVCIADIKEMLHIKKLRISNYDIIISRLEIYFNDIISRNEWELQINNKKIERQQAFSYCSKIIDLEKDIDKRNNSEKIIEKHENSKIKLPDLPDGVDDPRLVKHITIHTIEKTNDELEKTTDKLEKTNNNETNNELEKEVIKMKKTIDDDPSLKKPMETLIRSISNKNIERIKNIHIYNKISSIENTVKDKYKYSMNDGFIILNDNILTKFIQTKLLNIDIKDFIESLSLSSLKIGILVAIIDSDNNEYYRDIINDKTLIILLTVDKQFVLNSINKFIN
jgi:hypothetical protein